MRRRVRPAISPDRQLDYAQAIVEGVFGATTVIPVPNSYLTIGGRKMAKGFSWPDDEYDPAPPEEDQTPFLDEGEKATLIESGQTFWIHNVRLSPTGFGVRFFLDVTLDEAKSDALRTLGFDAEGRVESRDKLLKSMREYFRSDNGAEPIAVKMEQKGRAHLIVRA